MDGSPLLKWPSSHLREREREREKERGEIRSGLEMPAAAAGSIGKINNLALGLWG
jgi:hypothetical protein